MMYKIRHIRDMKEERMRLRIRQPELEKEIRSTWHELKETFEPATLLKNKFADVKTSERKEKDLLSCLLSRGVYYLIRKFFNSAGEKMSNAS
ncbi:MAG TPA: hypothetical protein VN451_06415 [Chitinophagaceae bacterium]|nr:hypothetical protein [Chitinophagaceae bacterium]